MSYILHQDVAPQDPWCDSSRSPTKQCIEAQLFRDWEHVAANPAEMHDKLERLTQHQSNGVAPVVAQSPIAIFSDVTVQPNTSLGEPSALFITHASNKSEAGDLKSPVHRRFENHTQAAAAAVKEWQNISTLGHHLQALHEQFGSKLERRRANTEIAQEEWSNLTAWARDVQALQQHLEAQFTPEKGHVKESKGTSEDNLTAWSRGLIELQQQLQSRMEAHNKMHAALHKKQHHRTDIPLLDQIAALGREMCLDPKRREYPQCSQFVSTSLIPHTTAAVLKSSKETATSDREHHWDKRTELDNAAARLKLELHQLSVKHQSWERKFVEKVADLGRELCSEPHRRGEKACMQFLGSTGNQARQSRHQLSATKIASVGLELCSNPMHHHYLICQKYFDTKSEVSNTSSDASQARHLNASEEAASSSDKMEQVTSQKQNVDTFSLQNNSQIPTKRIELHWRPATDQQHKSRKGLRGAATQLAPFVHSAELSTLRTSAHWSGRIPSVACVVVVPRSQAVKAWIHYFVDNFRLQNYEGQRYLVLVHHHTDHDIGDLLRKFADGSYIRIVAARGSEYPSVAAFRFGAWTARDADIIARWDYEAWHHPQQLSTQVRALAFAGRPASILSKWVVLNETGGNTTASEGKYWDSSITGEAAWMREHWYPGLDEEHTGFGAHTAQDLIRIDMPELLVFDDSCRPTA
jgi:hypothetical protein